MRHVKKKNESDGVSQNLALLPLKNKDIAVAGLIWQPIHTIRNIQLEAKNLIHNEKCAYFLTHIQGTRAQCGMTPSLPKGKRSWSAIMMLRESLGDSWLGLFRLPDNRFWLAAVDNGVVVPGGDSIFEDELLARERYSDYEGLFPWERKYSEGVDGILADHVELHDLLQQVELKSLYRINFAKELSRQVKSITSRVFLIVAALGIAIGGWNYYKEKKEQERIEQLRLERLARMRASGFENGAWRGQLPALGVVEKCTESLYGYPVSIAGWNIQTASCDGKTVKVQYLAGKKTSNKEFSSAMQGKPFSFQKNMTAVITEDIRVDGDRKKERLQPIIEVASNILEKLQLGIVKGKMDDVLSTNNKKAKFEFETQLSPLLVIKLKNMDGIVIHSIKGRMNTQGVLTWYISGEVYGK